MSCPTSDVSCRYPELQGLYIKQLQLALSAPICRDAFQKQLSRYFSGEIPHSRDILTSLLRALMDGTTVSGSRCETSDNCNTILRVSPPWPIRTKKALWASLDTGLFEDFHLMAPPSSVPTKYPVYFAGVVDGGVGFPFSRREF